jgi:DNA-binding NarL/FixJ family response regulator
VAVEPESLLRLIEHLLDRPEFRIVKALTEWPAMARESLRLHPDLIITNVKLLGYGAANILGDVKVASPASKLVVISFPHDLSRQALQWGADGYLKEEQLVRRLVPMAHKLVGLAPDVPGACFGREARPKSRATASAKKTDQVC